MPSHTNIQYIFNVCLVFVFLPLLLLCHCQTNIAYALALALVASYACRYSRSRFASFDFICLSQPTQPHTQNSSICVFTCLSVIVHLNIKQTLTVLTHILPTLVLINGKVLIENHFVFSKSAINCDLQSTASNTMSQENNANDVADAWGSSNG